MNLQSFFKKVGACMFASVCIFTTQAEAQRTRPAVSAAPTPTPTVVYERREREMAVAERNNLYCAGFVQTSPVDTSKRLVGGVEEQDQYHYVQGDVVYLSVGASSGVKVGDMMSVMRPRGQVKSRWSKKSGLGYFVQEVGAVEVFSVKQNVSVARVKTSCDSFLLGDLVQPMQERTSPMFKKRPAMDLYAEPNGKATGRVLMSRDDQEMITRDQIVYIDLGAEDNVKIGDYLTVYRPLGKGNLFFLTDDESVSARDGDFASDHYRGSRFSNQAARKSGDTADGRVVRTKAAKAGRPELRKVVGEMVIINVKERTATAVITRTAQEIHTGDHVEVQ